MRADVDGAEGVVVLGARQPRLRPRAVLRPALRVAARRARERDVRQRARGVPAFGNVGVRLRRLSNLVREDARDRSSTRPRRRSATRAKGTSLGCTNGPTSLLWPGTAATAIEALAATAARKTLKPMPASSWCHIFVAAGAAAHAAGERQRTPRSFRARACGDEAAEGAVGGEQARERARHADHRARHVRERPRRARAERAVGEVRGGGRRAAPHAAARLEAVVRLPAAPLHVAEVDGGAVAELVAQLGDGRREVAQVDERVVVRLAVVRVLGVGRGVSPTTPPTSRWRRRRGAGARGRRRRGSRTAAGAAAAAARRPAACGGACRCSTRCRPRSASTPAAPKWEVHSLMRARRPAPWPVGEVSTPTRTWGGGGGAGIAPREPRPERTPGSCQIRRRGLGVTILGVDVRCAGFGSQFFCTPYSRTLHIYFTRRRRPRGAARGARGRAPRRASRARWRRTRRRRRRRTARSARAGRGGARARARRRGSRGSAARRAGGSRRGGGRRGARRGHICVGGREGAERRRRQLRREVRHVRERRGGGEQQPHVQRRLEQLAQRGAEGVVAASASTPSNTISASASRSERKARESGGSARRTAAGVAASSSGGSCSASSNARPRSSTERSSPTRRKRTPSPKARRAFWCCANAAATAVLPPPAGAVRTTRRRRRRAARTRYARPRGRRNPRAGTAAGRGRACAAAGRRAARASAAGCGAARRRRWCVVRRAGGQQHKLVGLGRVHLRRAAHAFLGDGEGVGDGLADGEGEVEAAGERGGGAVAEAERRGDHVGDARVDEVGGGDRRVRAAVDEHELHAGVAVTRIHEPPQRRGRQSAPRRSRPRTRASAGGRGR